GYLKIVVQVDSCAIITLVTRVDNPVHQHVREIITIRKFFKTDWEVTISHVYREGNFTADYLGNHGHDYPSGMHLISLPDCYLSCFLRRDCMSISEPRLVPHYFFEKLVPH
ncbi:Putative ribonuclease H protein At1g65750, partial [Linum perenne]